MARQCSTQRSLLRGEPLRVAHSTQAPTQSRPAPPRATPQTNSSSQLPGPRSMPMLGWWPTVLPMLRDPAMSMLRLWRDYGDAVSLGTARGAPIIVFSPEYNHYVLTHNEIFHSLDVNSGDALIKVPPNTSAARLLSGIASMNGEEHTQHRRLLMPSFHKKRVDALRDSMVECIETHVATWKDGDHRVLTHEMLDLTLSIAIVGLIGLNPAEEGKRVRHLLEQWSQRGLTPQVALLPYDLPGTPYRRFRQLSEQVEAELIDIINRKRERVNSTEDDGSDGDALALLIHAQDEGGEQLSDSDLIGHLSTLFTAGHETTASALTWTLFLLTQHPHILADLTDELDSVLHGDAPSLEQMRSLPLLENVVNEGLRMFPPGMWIFRTAVEPFELGPYSQPALTQLIFSPTVTHYRPDIYSNPHKFNPRRWETINPSPYEYLPFGGGPRRCLGATFATLEMKLALAIILQRWRIEVPHGHRVDRSGTILSRPKDGPPITLHKQDHQFKHSSVTGNIHDLVDFGSSYN